MSGRVRQKGCLSVVLGGTLHVTSNSYRQARQRMLKRGANSYMNMQGVAIQMVALCPGFVRQFILCYEKANVGVANRKLEKSVIM